MAEKNQEPLTFVRLQGLMSFAKKKGENVSYSYRSAEKITERFHAVNDGTWSLILSDDLQEVAGEVYFKSTARVSNGKEAFMASAYVPASTPPTTKSGAFMMSIPQWAGAASSYARKYALQGLFAMADADIDDISDQKKIVEFEQSNSLDLDEIIRVTGYSPQQAKGLLAKYGTKAAVLDTFQKMTKPRKALPETISGGQVDLDIDMSQIVPKGDGK